MLRTLTRLALPLILASRAFSVDSAIHPAIADSVPVKPKPVAAATGAEAVVIPIHGEVDEGLQAFVDRAIDDALARTPRPSHIVFDVDTWGGRLDAAFEISDRISNVPNCSTVAFVKRKAISAGALIALSANRVYMAPGSTIGDCAPILAGGGEDGIKYAGEKIESPLRARFRALAKRNGFPTVLAEKMVSRDGGVFEVRRGTEPKEFVYQIDWEASDDSVKKGATVRTALADGQLLTMDNVEALDWGFSKGTFADAKALEDAQGWKETTTLETSWSEDFARWISKFVPILFMVGLAALYLEYKNPGFGMFGIIGLLSLGLALGSQYFVGLADHTELLLAGIGLLLIGIEILLFPGTLLLAGIGLALLGVALVLSLQSFTLPDPNIPWQMEEMRTNLTIVASTLIGGMILSFAAMKWVVPRLPGTDGAYLRDTLQDARSPQQSPDDSPWIGKTGRSTTPLRPVGRVLMEGAEFDAVSDAGLIPVGSAVVVVASRNGELVVRLSEEVAA